MSASALALAIDTADYTTEIYTSNGKTVTLDNSRDSNLTTFGKTTLSDRYLLKGESFQRMFGRVVCAYADNSAHAQRLYDYISKLWFMPATPVLSNGGTKRGQTCAES